MNTPYERQEQALAALSRIDGERCRRVAQGVPRPPVPAGRVPNRNHRHATSIGDRNQADPPATHSACVATPISAPMCTPPNARERPRTAGRRTGTATRTATRRNPGPRARRAPGHKSPGQRPFCGAALGNRTPDLRITSLSPRYSPTYTDVHPPRSGQLRGRACTPVYGDELQPKLQLKPPPSDASVEGLLAAGTAIAANVAAAIDATSASESEVAS